MDAGLNKLLGLGRGLGDEHGAEKHPDDEGEGSEVTAHPDPDDDIILMTHTGPEHIATTLDDRQAMAGKAPVSAGSSALRKALLTERLVGVSSICPVGACADDSLTCDNVWFPLQQARVVCNIYGHVHASPGQAWLGSVPVINPGSIRHGGNFALLTLRRASPTLR
eukprot:Plantae.Rhodophyta-Rhodochaete_pulchella.ctg19089.p1 GENE.Plantae.Rhodophyta-Rhodochaete_pulchella.ctg19089~~Plantae.Rhodophyta-Rhodochaete_pulchella.ctg19089.p1  ORF type:complete len:176 (+),score=17.99 Plantae.Rhodophyta-Rhodochaete_pulchella.ctg19089:31-528(+)